MNEIDEETEKEKRESAQPTVQEPVRNEQTALPPGKKKKVSPVIVIASAVGGLLVMAMVFVFGMATGLFFGTSKKGTAALYSDSSGILTEDGVTRFQEVKTMLDEFFMAPHAAETDQSETESGESAEGETTAETEAALSDEDRDTAVIKAYVDSLGDPYTVYYDQEEFEEFQNQLDGGSFSGIGVSVQQSLKTNLITVLKVYSDSPAEKAGFRKGDIITAVNGEDVTNQELDLVVTKIRGEVGTNVTVTVYRESENNYVDLTATRDTIEIEYVDAEMLENNVGYIIIDSFTDTTYAQFMKAYNSLKDQGMTSLIVDLRENGGGLVTSVCDMLDEFLPECEILSMSNEKDDSQDETYYSSSEQTITMPVVVLVDEYTASASEIFSGALQCYDRAEIIGTKTFGKGIVQTFYSLLSGGGIKITTSYYYLPNGECIHKKGITPDQAVEDDPETTDVDEVLQAGVDYLTK